jgi:hypothetical protein
VRAGGASHSFVTSTVVRVGVNPWVELVGNVGVVGSDVGAGATVSVTSGSACAVAAGGSITVGLVTVHARV